MKDFMPFEPSSLCFAGDFRSLRLGISTGTFLERIKLQLRANLATGAAEPLLWVNRYAKHCTVSVMAGTSSTPEGFVPCLTFQLKPIFDSSHHVSEEMFQHLKDHVREDPTTFWVSSVYEWCTILCMQAAFDKFESCDNIGQVLLNPIPDSLDMDLVGIANRAPNMFASLFADLYTVQRTDSKGISRPELQYRIILLTVIWVSEWLNPLDPRDNAVSHVLDYLMYWWFKVRQVLNVGSGEDCHFDTWVYEYTIHERAISVSMNGQNLRNGKANFGDAFDVISVTGQTRFGLGGLFLPREG